MKKMKQENLGMIPDQIKRIILEWIWSFETDGAWTAHDFQDILTKRVDKIPKNILECIVKEIEEKKIPNKFAIQYCATCKTYKTKRGKEVETHNQAIDEVTKLLRR